jgi:ATP-dependent exoDNAse (exonuclease V) alpha subunit
VPIAFAECTTHFRSSGHSSVAAAAYRQCAKLYDERTGLTHDYRRKRHHIDTVMVVPETAPDWASDPSKLWNWAEKQEKRGNARICREIKLALPAELSLESQKKIAGGFAEGLARRHGVAVQVSIHHPHKDGDDRNIHAHVLFTTRRLTEDKLGEKTRELDQKTQSYKHIEAARADWGCLVNQALAEEGIGERIDMRSYKRQGVDKEGQVHLGPAATALERKGVKTDLGDRNREIATRNELKSLEKSLKETEHQIATLERVEQKHIERRVLIATEMGVRTRK